MSVQELYQNTVNPQEVVKNPDQGKSIFLFCCFCQSCFSIWVQAYFSILAVFSCLTRKHHEGCVSGSSPVGQTGHPGHEGNTCRILSSTHTQALTHAVSTVHPNCAETGWRPLPDPQHQTQSYHTGDPPGRVRWQRPSRRLPAAGGAGPTEPTAYQKSCRGRSICKWIRSPHEEACWLMPREAGRGSC